MKHCASASAFCLSLFLAGAILCWASAEELPSAKSANVRLPAGGVVKLKFQSKGTGLEPPCRTVLERVLTCAGCTLWKEGPKAPDCTFAIKAGTLMEKFVFYFDPPGVVKSGTLDLRCEGKIVIEMGKSARCVQEFKGDAYRLMIPTGTGQTQVGPLITEAAERAFWAKGSFAEALIEAVCYMSSPSRLAPLLTDPSEQLRVAAHNAYREIGTPEALGVLEEAETPPQPGAGGG